MTKRQILIDGWRNAGEDYVADRLKKVFAEIDTREEAGVHNDVVREIRIVIGDDNANDFFKRMARLLVNTPKDFLRGLANLIRNN